ncbi:MAG: lysine--tRNA ligase [Bdellovibrionota bacterium]
MAADTPKATPVPTLELSEQSRVRREKLEEWRASGNAYPHNIKVTHGSREIVSKYSEEHDVEKLKAAGDFTVAGRVSLLRSFGKSGFLKLKDRDDSIQAFIAKDILSESDFALWKKLDLGDQVRVSGHLFRTKTGELTLEAKSLQVLTKCLHAPPEKFHGLTDVEEKYRRRYLDLMSNDETRKVFKQRSQIVQGVRDYFLSRDFLEVETPMMHSLVGGAAARPFVTHHNTLDMQLFLRIAPELYLKRLVVGGFERVFEINRNFRNEGISIRHNPEFTMLEFYMAYATYDDLMNMTEEMVRGLSQKLHGTTDIEWLGQKLNLGSPWSRISMENACLTMSGYKGKLQDQAALAAYLKERGAKLSGREAPGHLLTLLFEEDVEKQLTQPTFVTGYPVEVSPLARRAPEKSPQGFDVTERFELFVAGQEIANGFNELNDPDDQKQRFLSQLKEKEAGNIEATDYDADYILALEYGLPPTAGEGIGIDRLTMMLTNSDSIRDVILFPQLKKEKV